MSYAPMAVDGLPTIEVEAWTGQLGGEPSIELYVGHLVAVFRLVRCVLRDDGTLWLNLGDTYDGGGGGNYGDSKSTRTHAEHLTNVRNRIRLPGLKAKDLMMIPARVALALQADGWYLRSEIIWHKPNPMPESVTDRPTRAHEQIFLLAKSQKYFWDQEAVREKEARQWTGERNGQMWSSRETEGIVLGREEAPNCGLENSGSNPAGRNVRTVWKIATEPSTQRHYAGWPSRLVAPMIKAGTSERGVCASCGVPWERVVERMSDGSNDAAPNQHSIKANALQAMESRRDANRRGAGTSFSNNPADRVGGVKTTGWRPTCSCYDFFYYRDFPQSRKPKRRHYWFEQHWFKRVRSRGLNELETQAWNIVPATVLDCFAGTGTTADVARRLGRRSIMIEPSAEYARMQREQLHSKNCLRHDDRTLLAG